MGYCINYCVHPYDFTYCGWMLVLFKWNKLCVKLCPKILFRFLKSPLILEKAHCYKDVHFFIPFFWNETLYLLQTFSLTQKKNYKMFITSFFTHFNGHYEARVSYFNLYYCKTLTTSYSRFYNDKQRSIFFALITFKVWCATWLNQGPTAYVANA